MSPRPARPIPRSRRAAAPVPGERLAGQVGEEVRLALHGAGRLRMPEFLLFAALAVSGLPISAIPGGLENVIVAVICVLALLRRPVRELGPWQALVPVMVLALAYIAVVSLTAEQGAEAADWRLRLLRISTVLVLLMVMGTGRIDVRSGVAGYAAAAVVNVPLFYAGAVPSTYGGFLTGFFGDKNVSGLVYCVIGLLTVYFVRRPGARVATAGAFAAMVWLTGSRTAIAAYLCALAWVLLARRLGMVGRWLMGIGVGLIVHWTAEDFSQVGVFSDREGSDILRSRIDAASELKVQAAGFVGRGLGEAYVVLEDGTWFFHNAYWTLLVEGGWPWTIVIVGITAAVMLRPFAAQLTPAEVFAQAVGVAILVCATRLGEVFLTVQWAIAMGFALAVTLEARAGAPPVGEGEVSLRDD